MKTLARTAYIFIVSMVLLFSAALPALACELELVPVQNEAVVGETVAFTLTRYQTHRTCPVPLEDTIISADGGEVTDPGVWATGTPDTLNFTVTFDQAGSGTVTVTRLCDKTPKLMTSASVEVVAKPPGSTNPSAPTGGDDSGTYPATSTVGGKPSESSGYDAARETSGSDTASLYAYISALFKSWLPAWITVDSNWIWWIGFLLVALGAQLMNKQALRTPIMISGVIILGFYLGACPCPMGGIFKVFIQSISLVFIVILLSALIWGRFFCGWVCPMGSIQEFLHISGQRFTIPNRVDSILKLLKYLVLTAFVIITLLTGYNAWMDVDPFKALFNFSWTLPAAAILLAVLLGSLLVERFFCRYLCPLGALLAIVARIRAWLGFSAAGDLDICTACSKCVKQGCPVGAIQMMGEGREARPLIVQSECLSCGRCRDACPKSCIKL